MGDDGRQGPAATDLLHSLLPRLGEFGITRLGDITGLDRIGIPVMQATRPLSLSNSVAQGKGSSREVAALSAILEAAECFFAERVARFAVTMAPARELGVDPDAFARHKTEDCPSSWAEEAVAWVEAEDLLSQNRAFVPFALVHTAYVHPPVRQDAWFQASTSGLAVAANWHDAVLHGLLECFERDALARAERTHGFFQRCRIDPETIDDAQLSRLIDELRRNGLLVGLWRAEALGGVPVFWCHLLEEDSQAGTLIPHPADGSAAGLDPASAAKRAIREAAQSRLAAISGAREDITRLSYPRYPDWDMIEAHRRLLRDGPRPIRFDSVGAEMPEDWLASLIERGRAAGLSAINVVDLDIQPFADLAAVKVFVPDLEPLGGG